MSKVKLKDIADKAGVSMMTVSRVMNDDPKVGAKTRDRILAIAQDMQYRPNIAARHLASSKSYFIGIFCDFANASYVNKFLVGALRKCRSSGYHVVIDEATGDTEKALTALHDLLNVIDVDGLILLPPISDNRDVIAVLQQSKTPFVRISPNIRNEADTSISPYICIDDFQAAFDITEALIKTGHRSIAHILGHPDQDVSAMRYKGYCSALQKYGLELRTELVAQGLFTYKSGLDAAQKLLSLGQKPDAIFAANDEMAAAVISVAHMKHLDVPSNLSVVGFDDTELSTTVWPHISTISQPLEQMAEVAIDLIMNIGKDTKSIATPRHVLNYAVQQRGSSK